MVYFKEAPPNLRSSIIFIIKLHQNGAKSRRTPEFGIGWRQTHSRAGLHIDEGGEKRGLDNVEGVRLE